MSAWADKIVIAEGPGPLRDQLQTALDANQARYVITDSGVELKAALSSAHPPAAVIVGQGLSGLGGIDVLYLSQKESGSGKRREKPAIILLTDIRADLEILEVLRRRHVSVFLYRNDPIDQLATSLIQIARGNVRAHPRFPTKLACRLFIADQWIQGTISNASAGGCCLVYSPSRRLELPVVGDQVGLSFSVEDHQVECNGEVRRVRSKRRLLRNAVELGLRFVGPTFESRKAIEAAIGKIQLAFEVRQDKSWLKDMVPWDHDATAEKLVRAKDPIPDEIDGPTTMSEPQDR